MTLRPGANEIRQLVRRLGSRSSSRVNEARSRLAIIGARSVDGLVEALDVENPRLRGHAMQMLTLLQHPRGRDALVGLLLDRDARTRESAALFLSRFSSPSAVAALETVLARESSTDVRVAAVTGLIDLYRTGQESAVRPVLEALISSREDSRVREAAMALLPHLKSPQRRAILQRVRDDPDGRIAKRANEIEDIAPSSNGGGLLGVERALEKLASSDYTAWHDAVRTLAANGSASVVPVVHAMQRRAHDAEYCARGGMVLKAIGSRCGRALGSALDHVDEPLPLSVLVEVVGSIGEKALVYKLRDLLGRLRRGRKRRSVDGFDPLQRVRAKAHLELARVGSRVAVPDLIELISSRDRPIEVDALDALEIIGTREEIPVLLDAWTREDRSARRRIGEVVRSIMRRERIRRNSRALAALDPDRRRALDGIARRTERRRTRP